MPHYCPENGHGWISPLGPRHKDLGRWLYGLPASFSDYLLRYPIRARKVDRVFEGFVQFDALGRAWRRAARAAGAGQPRQRVQALHHRQMVASDRALAQRRLEAALRWGLSRRVGDCLHGDENVWMAFAARGFQVPGLRVCEQCAVVFEAPRARRCAGCRKQPVRVHLYPVEQGGWHSGYRVGGRWASETFDRVVHYSVVCRSCERRFETQHPRRQLCRNCGNTAGRLRRLRSSSSVVGRRIYRYVSEDGAQLQSCGAVGPRGESLTLLATNGILETRDEEIARQLDANSSLWRLQLNADRNDRASDG